MWKCKKCGGRKFEIDKRIIDRDSGSKKSTLNIKDINGSVMCCKCYNHGEDIRDIVTLDGEMKIDLNKLMDYKSLAYASDMAQLEKVKEEYKELLAEVRETSTFIEIKNRDNFIAEGLDLITATVNLLLVSNITEEDFKKHIEKLESYKNGKYKK